MRRCKKYFSEDLFDASPLPPLPAGTRVCRCCRELTTAPLSGHTTHMDVGSAVFAGAKNSTYIACRDAGMPLLSGTDNGPVHRRSCASPRPRHTVHPVHRRSCASLRPRHTVHPVHRRSCASLRPRHTVHPVHRRSCASLRPRHTVHPVHKNPAGKTRRDGGPDD
ncbi:MAG: hypothetical protein ACI9W6_000568 [Motiliproteus sp.]|jgi:hypothetical protein